MPRSSCELRRTAVGLQYVGTKHHRSLVKRQPVEWLAMLNRRQDTLCHLGDDEVLNEECLLKAERERDAVIQG